MQAVVLCASVRICLYHIRFCFGLYVHRTPVPDTPVYNQELWTKHEIGDFYLSLRYAMPQIIFAKSKGADIDLSRFIAKDKLDRKDLEYCNQKIKECGIGEATALSGTRYVNEVMRNRGQDMQKAAKHVSFSEENLTTNAIQNIKFKIQQIQEKAAQLHSTSKTEMYGLRFGGLEFVQKVLKLYDPRLPDEVMTQYLGLVEEATDLLMEIWALLYGQDAIVQVKIETLRECDKGLGIFKGSLKRKYINYMKEMGYVMAWGLDILTLSRRALLATSGVQDYNLESTAKQSLLIPCVQVASHLQGLIENRDSFWKVVEYFKTLTIPGLSLT